MARLALGGDSTWDVFAVWKQKPGDGGGRSVSGLKWDMLGLVADVTNRSCSCIGV